MDSKAAAKALVAAAEKNGAILSKGNGEVNIIYVEGMNDDFTRNKNEPNKFNDLRTVVKYQGGVPILAGVWEATTEPSKRWTLNPMNAAGAARIAFGQQKAWQIGYHHDDPGHEALVQTGGPVKVYRDGNKDYSREGDKLDTGYFGINQHHGYDLPHDDMGGSSAGCLVGRSRAGHKEFMAIVKSDPRANVKGFVFSTTVIPAAAVVAADAGYAPQPKKLADSTGYISKAAEDFIIATEVGDVHMPQLEKSKAAYEARYHRPTWPGGESGVTIGIGYDVGAGVEDAEELKADWAGRIPAAMIDVMTDAIGVTGEPAKAFTAALKPMVDIPWDAAVSVFRNRDIPREYNRCKRMLPNFETLSGDCRGALVSLVFNRGASFDKDGDRYTEMRKIKQLMSEKKFDEIPAQFTAMKRLWRGRGLDGLLERRDCEADLFSQGLKKDDHVPETKPSTSAAAGGAAGAVVAGGSVAGAVVTHASEISWIEIGLIAGAVVILGLVVFLAIKAWRK